MSRKKTDEQFKKEFSIKGDSNIELLGEYTGQKVVIPARCKVCGYEYNAWPMALLRGSGCKKCKGLFRKTTEEFSSELRLVNPDILVVGEYLDNKKHIDIICKKCNNNWSASPVNLLKGYGCPVCNGGIRKEEEVFLAEMKALHPDIEILEPYKSALEKIEFKCKRCGNGWKTTPSQLINAKSGCPSCAHTQTSFIEQCILEICRSVFGSQRVISRDRSIIGCELDIVILDENFIPMFAIEPGSWTLHCKPNIQIRDEEKRTLCKAKNIPLLTIYDQDRKGEVESTDEIWSYSHTFSVAKYESVCRLLKRISQHFDFSVEEIDFESVIKTAHEKSRRISTTEFKQQLSEINPNLVVIGEYNGSMRKTLVECKKCKYRWEPTPQMLLKLKTGCPKCANVPRKNTESFIEEMKTINPNIIIEGKYINAKTKIEVRCKICNHIYQATPDKLHSGRGCPKCAEQTRGAKSRKAVINVTTGKLYPSIRTAEMETGINNIGACCRGVIKLAGGFKWEFFGCEQTPK